MTYALQVLHTLLWTQPLKDDTIQAATPTHTRYLELQLKKLKALVAYLRNCKQTQRC